MAEDVLDAPVEELEVPAAETTDSELPETPAVEGEQPEGEKPIDKTPVTSLFTADGKSLDPTIRKAIDKIKTENPSAAMIVTGAVRTLPARCSLEMPNPASATISLPAAPARWTVRPITPLANKPASAVKTMTPRVMASIGRRNARAARKRAMKREIALLGGFSGIGGGPFYGTGYYGGGGLGLVVIVLLILVLLGKL